MIKAFLTSGQIEYKIFKVNGERETGNVKNGGRVNGEGMRLNNGSVLILRNVARKGGETETQRLE